MLDEKDLQAIGQLLQKHVSESEQRITKNVAILMDADFKPRVDLLAEGQGDILENLQGLEDVDILDTRISVLEAMVKKLNREVSQLRKTT